MYIVKRFEHDNYIENGREENESDLSFFFSKKCKLVETVVPLLSQVIGEEIREGVFQCNNIPERVKMSVPSNACK
ncbi:hypothetical protein SAMN02910370_01109 [Lachnospiraceae bacterium XPB1003]|nr:hypothetical protein SAMN02910370_01109 [Lachnospiraceae bacterium XPB1003]